MRLDNYRAGEVSQRGELIPVNFKVIMGQWCVILQLCELQKCSMCVTYLLLRLRHSIRRLHYFMCFIYIVSLKKIHYLVYFIALRGVIEEHTMASNINET